MRSEDGNGLAEVESQRYVSLTLEVWTTNSLNIFSPRTGLEASNNPSEQVELPLTPTPEAFAGNLLQTQVSGEK